LLPEFGGSRLDVVAATRDGARGRTADFLWIDELREIDEQAFIAASPVTRARANSQSLYTSNAGDNFSKVLNDMRNRAQEYPPKQLGYWEYSAPQYCKIDLNSDEFWDAIAMANPSLNYTVTEDAIRETIAISSVESIRTETLCSWIDALSSPWPMGILEETSDSDLTMAAGPYTVFGFDVSPSKRNASLCAGQILPDGRIGIGILETYYSDTAVDDLKIAASIKAWCDIYRPKLVLHDKYTTATISERLANAGVKVQDISGQKFYQACSDYLDSLVNHRVVHSGQEIFIEQMNNCAAKESDHGWRIIRRKSAGDVSAPISLAMIVSTLMKPQSVPQIYT
jgi:phage terminase large subunit-like protein